MSGLSVNTNAGVLTALRFLEANTLALDGVRDRVSSGLRIAGPRDDGSTFSVAQGLRADIKAWGAVDTALSMAEGLLNVTLAAATTISDILGDLKKKVIEHAGADTAGQSIIATDIENLLDRIDLVAESAWFAETNLITADDSAIVVPQPPDEGVEQSIGKGPGPPVDGASHSLGAVSGTLRVNYELTSGSGGAIRVIYDGNIVASSGLGGPNSPGSLTFAYPAAPAQDFNIQITGGSKTLDYTFFLDTNVSSNATGTYRVLSDVAGRVIEIQHRSMRAVDIELDLGSLLGSGQAGLNAVDAALREIASSSGYYAAKLSQVTQARRAAGRFQDALSEGLGSLVDADLALESARLVAGQVREALSLSSLAIANQRPRVILDLLEAVRSSGSS